MSISAEKLSELKDALVGFAGEAWKVANQHGPNEAARADVKRLGVYVYRPYLGAIAAVPKDSGQFSRHEAIVKYIAAFDPITATALLDEIELLRGELDDLKTGKTAIIPKTTEHAENLLAVAEGCLRPSVKRDSEHG